MDSMKDCIKSNKDNTRFHNYIIPVLQADRAHLTYVFLLVRKFGRIMEGFKMSTQLLRP